MLTKTRASIALSGTWLIAGLVILGYAGVEHLRMLKSDEPFLLSMGAEQSVLIFEAIGIYSLAESTLRFRTSDFAYWVRKVVSFVVFLDAFVWLLFGGPAYERWFFSMAIAMLLVASGWSLLLPRASITPNSTPHTDARASSVLDQPPSARAGGRGR